ncbi:acetylcholine receptor subunit alpha [Biomphalaria pfeifferi]|uniref:Acetylcholine receptor subunit alpha n=1 Tax=Biomphalaria pfeifferi TaxID=112525 RepID=A0AAD8FFT8_BIOPF|nr:acetylcholine receptor subunit alpha [Biomphalaria pfeifferi]
MFVFVTLAAMLGVTNWSSRCYGQTYNQTKCLYENLINDQAYHTEIRPLIDQDMVMDVGVSFNLISIVEVNDVSQSFSTNGFLTLSWLDEYGGQRRLHPLPKKIWRPRVLILNTLQDRDIFDDDKAPVYVNYNGSTTWSPGSLFPASCELKMIEFPFDRHTCTIQLISMMYSNKELQFVAASPLIERTFYSDNGEWDLKEASVYVSIVSSGNTNFSLVQLQFTIERKPMFLLLSVFLPVIFLSFLDLFVFVIPVESGMKINYGITVLLALSTFMSMVSTMIPKSSLAMAYVVFYLFAVFILSMLTVIESIGIVCLYNFHPGLTDLKDQQDEKAVLEGDRVRSVSELMNSCHSKAMSNDDEFQKSTRDGPNETQTVKRVESQTSRNVLRYRLYVIGHRIDLVSLCVFTIVWLSMTFAVFSRISYL